MLNSILFQENEPQPAEIPDQPASESDDEMNSNSDSDEIEPVMEEDVASDTGSIDTDAAESEEEDFEEEDEDELELLGLDLTDRDDQSSARNTPAQSPGKCVSVYDYSQIAPQLSSLVLVLDSIRSHKYKKPVNYIFLY